MTDQKTPAERAVELLLFAPVGLALSARDLLPELVERGRQQVTGQVTLAKMLGQFAVQQGQAEAEKAFGRARSQAETALGQVFRDGAGTPTPASTTTRPTPSSSAPAPTATTPTAPSAPVAVPAPEPEPSPTPRPVAKEPATRAGDGTPAVGDLAVPDYDSLSASQVLPRLSALSPEELEAVRSYETANRGRKTVLNKVAQLQGA